MHRLVVWQHVFSQPLLYNWKICHNSIDTVRSILFAQWHWYSVFSVERTLVALLHWRTSSSPPLSRIYGLVAVFEDPGRRLYFLGSVENTWMSITGSDKQVRRMEWILPTFSWHLHLISRSFTTFPESRPCFGNERGMTNATVFRTIILFAGTIATVI